jgi:hypothetical protein
MLLVCNLMGALMGPSVLMARVSYLHMCFWLLEQLSAMVALCTIVPRVGSTSSATPMVVSHVYKYL